MAYVVDRFAHMDLPKITIYYTKEKENFLEIMQTYTSNKVLWTRVCGVKKLNVKNFSKAKKRIQNATTCMTMGCRIHKIVLYYSFYVT